MATNKCAYEGNQFVGLYFCTSDKLTLVPRGLHQKMPGKLGVLGTTLVEASVCSSSLLGLYCSMNSNGIVVPDCIEQNEMAALKKEGLNVCVLECNRNACGNNIAANDYGAVANPLLPKACLSRISDALGVEVVQSDIAGMETVGCCVAATNKGFVAHNESSEQELKFISSVLKVEGGVGTCNMGTPFPKLGIVANSTGALVGEATSGFELARIESSLGLV
ncbi:translation initiation factor IF-6 [Candidatus Parvarchaeota archaeon]|nr:translation initiation factor IF-6 [Candidatus Parvarchaeota archaeon]